MIQLQKALRRAVWTAAAGLAVAIGLGAPAAEARAPIRCTAVAIDGSGRYILGTEAQVEDEARRVACQRALVLCDQRLREVRYRHFRKLPTARCDLIEAYPTNAYDPQDPAYDDNLDQERPVNWPAYVGGAGAQSRCNYTACARKYKSFRDWDCSYQPYGGPRRICDIPLAPPPSRAADPGYCNYAACSRRYQSFSNIDCTYVSSYGQRLRCDIPPSPPPYRSRVVGGRPVDPGYCNYDVCSRKYKSFQSWNCSYQPYGGGPRRRCDFGPYAR